MTNLSQTEKALSKGAEYVNTARGDVKGKCNVLSDRVNEMMGGWGGQGASAFGNLMVAWQEKQETILKALDQLCHVDAGDREGQRRDRRVAVADPHQPPEPPRLTAATTDSGELR